MHRQNRGADIDRRSGLDRRSESFRGSIYGALRGRRRGARRGGDRIGYRVDVHHSPRLYFVVLVMLLCGLDAVLTLNVLRTGGVEVNPFMAWLIEHDIQMFASIKMALTGLCLVILVEYGNFRLLPWVPLPVASLLPLILSGYSALIVYELFLVGVLPV